MSFPDLQLKSDPTRGPGGTQELFAEATGIPDSGDNTFGLPFVAAGVSPSEIDEEKLKIFLVFQDGNTVLTAGVTFGHFVSLSPDKTQMTFNFVQAAPGSGQARLVVQIQHSLTR